MTQDAKSFINGKSRAARLPVACQFDTKEVFTRNDPETGDVIRSNKPVDWGDFLSAIQGTDVPPDFLGTEDREHGTQNRDPFAGCSG